jgi:hypothetical protein
MSKLYQGPWPGIVTLVLHYHSHYNTLTQWKHSESSGKAGQGANAIMPHSQLHERYQWIILMCLYSGFAAYGSTNNGCIDPEAKRVKIHNIQIS